MNNTERMNAIFDAAESDLITMSEARQQAVEIVEEQQEEYQELTLLVREAERIWKKASEDIRNEINEIREDVKKQKSALKHING